MVKGEVSHELEVTVPASKVWEVYGTLQLVNLVAELVPTVLRKVEVVEGDGGLGTVIRLTFAEGVPGPSSYNEKFTTLDNEKRLKHADVVEGGYLDLGFTLYRTRFEIIEKDAESSIIRSSIIYELDDKYADNSSLVTTNAVALIAQVIANYLTEKKAAV